MYAKGQLKSFFALQRLNKLQEKNQICMRSRFKAFTGRSSFKDLVAPGYRHGRRKATSLGKLFGNMQQHGHFQQMLTTQCAQVVQEIRAMSSLSVSEAAPLVAMIQRSQVWTELRETLCNAINGKVADCLSGMKRVGGPTSSSRFPLFPVLPDQ